MSLVFFEFKYTTPFSSWCHINAWTYEILFGCAIHISAFTFCNEILICYKKSTTTKFKWNLTEVDLDKLYLQKHFILGGLVITPILIHIPVDKL